MIGTARLFTVLFEQQAFPFASCCELVTEVKGSTTALQLCLCRPDLIAPFSELCCFSHMSHKAAVSEYSTTFLSHIRSSPLQLSHLGFISLLTKTDQMDAWLTLNLCEVSFSDIQNMEQWETESILETSYKNTSAKSESCWAARLPIHLASLLLQVDSREPHFCVSSLSYVEDSSGRWGQKESLAYYQVLSNSCWHCNPTANSSC